MAVFQVRQRIISPNNINFIDVLTPEFENRFQEEVTALGKIITKTTTTFYNPQGQLVHEHIGTFASEDDYVSFISTMHENTLTTLRSTILQENGFVMVIEPMGYIEK